MSTTDRQNRLLLAEDWKTVYQSFKYADFQSYDFDNLRRTMINYIRQNYPEDFNDYIESSEYLALIDLIAFLGQNLAFRTDLNARENYIETADRRESVLRLARLISYNPKRNQAANGLLKVESVSTTEDVVDSNGTNLSNQTVIWNDGSNANWYEQFIKIMNAALPTNNVFGRPIKKSNIGGVSTEQYRFNGTNTDVPVYSFSKNINSSTTVFEIVSTGIDDDNGVLVEEEPLPGNKFALVYRDNGQGSGSTNTGFFMHFRQGRLVNNTFTVDNSTPNTVVNIDTDNINNSDIWLYKLDSTGNENELWTKVDSVEGNNIIYNSLAKNERNIFSVLSRVSDRISLIFSDGVFGTIPKGSFKVYYRTSANKSYKILPADLTNINVQIPYTSKTGKQETLNLILELQDVVDNASVSEPNDSIKQNAPSTYYTQNRLITGEDYNIGPLNVNQEIIKVKSVNRTSSGISRYYDLRDATGKYSNTTLFGNDGSIYKESIDFVDSFEFITRTDIEAVVNNKILPIIGNDLVRNFYYTNFPRNETVRDLEFTFKQATADTNRTTGIFQDRFDISQAVSTFTQGILKNIEPGALIKFVPPEGFYFDKNNNLVEGTPTALNQKTYIWSKVISVSGNGTIINADTGLGAIVFNDIIPDGVIIDQIISKLSGNLENDVVSQIVDQAFAFRAFGLRYDLDQRQWTIIENSNLDTTSDFSLGKSGDATNQQLDASWIILFQTDGEKYTVTYRGVRYVFQSDKEIRFYFDSNSKVYDSRTGQIVKDSITVLSNNNMPDSLNAFTEDFVWEMSKAYKDSAGYIDSKKVEVTFYDSDNDGVIDNPDVFDLIVAPTVAPTTKYIFAKKTVQNGIDTYNYINADDENILVVQTEAGIGALSQYDVGTVFYIVAKDIFKKITATNVINFNTDYAAHIGRDDLKFRYIHAADENRRIDPSSSNIMDIYMLTKQYDTDYRDYIQGKSSVPVLPPSSDSLFRSYGADINKIKSVSDEVIYHPVKYKPLFGSVADVDLQAVFKIVKNPGRVVNDNDVKARIIDAINEYFSLENWDFGETFYFSELAAYIINQVSPDVSSIVLVPRQDTQGFGSLYEIKSENDEIFVNSATVQDVEIIDAITASRLKATGLVVTSDTDVNSGVQSASDVETVIITGDSN